MSGAAPTKQQAAQSDTKRSPAEWVTFGVAALIMLAVVGLIVYDWIGTPISPPELTVVQTGEAEPVGEQYRVMFELRNAGGETAEMVQVIAELERDGEVVEDGEQQIDFLSPGESASGAFLFGEDPAGGTLTLRVASYTEP